MPIYRVSIDLPDISPGNISLLHADYRLFLVTSLRAVFVTMCLFP